MEYKFIEFDDASRIRVSKKNNLNELIKEIESNFVLLKNTDNKNFASYPLVYDLETHRIKAKEDYSDCDMGQIKTQYWCEACKRTIGDVWNHAEEHILNKNNAETDSSQSKLKQRLNEIKKEKERVYNVPYNQTEKRREIISFIKLNEGELEEIMAEGNKINDKDIVNEAYVLLEEIRESAYLMGEMDILKKKETKKPIQKETKKKSKQKSTQSKSQINKIINENLKKESASKKRTKKKGKEADHEANMKRIEDLVLLDNRIALLKNEIVSLVQSDKDKKQKSEIERLFGRVGQIIYWRNILNEQMYSFIFNKQIELNEYDYYKNYSLKTDLVFDSINFVNELIEVYINYFDFEIEEENFAFEQLLASPLLMNDKLMQKIWSKIDVKSRKSWLNYASGYSSQAKSLDPETSRINSFHGEIIKGLKLYSKVWLYMEYYNKKGHIAGGLFQLFHIANNYHGKQIIIEAMNQMFGKSFKILYIDEIKIKGEDYEYIDIVRSSFREEEFVFEVILKSLSIEDIKDVNWRDQFSSIIDTHTNISIDLDYKIVSENKLLLALSRKQYEFEEFDKLFKVTMDLLDKCMKK